MIGARDMEDAWALLERIEKIKARLALLNSYHHDTLGELYEERDQLQAELRRLEGMCT